MPSSHAAERLGEAGAEFYPSSRKATVSGNW